MQKTAVYSVIFSKVDFRCGFPRLIGMAMTSQIQGLDHGNPNFTCPKLPNFLCFATLYQKRRTHRGQSVGCGDICCACRRILACWADSIELPNRSSRFCGRQLAIVLSAQRRLDRCLQRLPRHGATLALVFSVTLLARLELATQSKTA